MAIATTLQRLVDDELERAPLLMQQLLSAAAADARLSSPLRTMLASHERRVADSFASALREQVEQTASPMPTGGSIGDLALVDDDDVAADVAISRVIEAIDSEAEYELREFTSYVAALIGDVEISRPSNPLGAPVYARALWDALQALPLPGAQHVALLQALAAPFARLLRQAYAAASTRLDDSGVEPAAYRTIVLAPGTREPRDPVAPRADLDRLRESVPGPLDGSPPSDGGVDRQAIELLTRLFDALLRDAQLPRAAHWLLSRLQASVLRVGLDDATLLDDERHPVWRFVDRLAFDAQVLGDEGEVAQQWARHAERLVDDMVHGARQDAELYRWGLQRLDAHARYLLQRRQADAHGALDAAVAGEQHAPAVDHGPTLDVASLETVPADLLAHEPADASRRLAEAGRWLDERADGALLTLFLRRRWRVLQLLERTPPGDVWLLYELPSGPPHTVRRGALQRLRAEGLAQPCEPRSLLRDAAQAVLRELGDAPR